MIGGVPPLIIFTVADPSLPPKHVTESDSVVNISSLGSSTGHELLNVQLLVSVIVTVYVPENKFNKSSVLYGPPGPVQLYMYGTPVPPLAVISISPVLSS